MISVAISLCVLALAASVSGAVWSITLWRRTLALVSQAATMQQSQRALAQKLVQLQNAVSECRRAAPTSLAAEVAALAEAVARLRATHQRFAGRFDQHVSAERASEPNGIDDEGVVDFLHLQNAPPAGPGS